MIDGIRRRLFEGRVVFFDQALSSLGNVAFAFIVASGSSSERISEDAIRFVIYQAAIGVNRYVFVDPALRNGGIGPKTPASLRLSVRTAGLAFAIGLAGAPIVTTNVVSIAALGVVIALLAQQELLRFSFLADARLFPVCVYQGTWVVASISLAFGTDLNAFSCWSIGGLLSLALGVALRWSVGWADGYSARPDWRNLPEYFLTAGFVVAVWSLVKVVGGYELSAQLRVGQTVLGGSGVLLLMFVNQLSLRSRSFRSSPWPVLRRQIMTTSALFAAVTLLVGGLLCALPEAWLTEFFPLWPRARSGTIALAVYQAVSAFDMAGSVTSRSLGRSLQTSRLRIFWVLGSLPLLIVAMTTGRLVLFSSALAASNAALSMAVWATLWRTDRRPLANART